MASILEALKDQTPATLEDAFQFVFGAAFGAGFAIGEARS
jgi:RsiW-degrading membrane proteinase PrsW (M82 family)